MSVPGRRIWQPIEGAPPLPTDALEQAMIRSAGQASIDLTKWGPNGPELPFVRNGWYRCHGQHVDAPAFSDQTRFEGFVWSRRAWLGEKIFRKDPGAGFYSSKYGIERSARGKGNLALGLSQVSALPGREEVENEFVGFIGGSPSCLVFMESKGTGFPLHAAAEYEEAAHGHQQTPPPPHPQPWRDGFFMTGSGSVSDGGQALFSFVGNVGGPQMPIQIFADGDPGGLNLAKTLILGGAHATDRGRLDTPPVLNARLMTRPIEDILARAAAFHAEEDKKPDPKTRQTYRGCLRLADAKPGVATALLNWCDVENHLRPGPEGHPLLSREEERKALAPLVRLANLLWDAQLLVSLAAFSDAIPALAALYVERFQTDQGAEWQQARADAEEEYEGSIRALITLEDTRGSPLPETLPRGFGGAAGAGRAANVFEADA